LRFQTILIAAYTMANGDELSKICSDPNAAAAEEKEFYDFAHYLYTNYAGSGNRLADGSLANRCGVAYGATNPTGDTRSGVTDVHYTPGVPLNVQVTLKAYF